MVTINKNSIAFKGSLKVSCNNQEQLKAIRERHGDLLNKINEELIDKECDDVLILEPVAGSTDNFRVYSDRNRNLKQTFNFQENNDGKKNKEAIVKLFEKIKSGIKDGSCKKADVIAFSELPVNTIVSPVIGTKVNHIGIITDDNQKFLESIVPATRTMDFKTRLEKNFSLVWKLKRKAYILKLNPEKRKILEKNSAKFDEAVKFFEKTGYDVFKFAAMAIKKFIPDSVRKKENLEPKNVVCSELAALILRKTGMLGEGKEPNWMTPRDFMDMCIYSDTFERITKVK